MNHTGIFDDLNYMSSEEHFKEFARAMFYASQPIKLEFMDYVTKGMKSFLKSPF